MITNTRPRQRLEPAKTKNCGGCICGTAIVALLISIVAIVLAAVAVNTTGNFTSQKLYESSGEIFTGPLQSALGSAGPLSMTLPNDLTNYVGKRYTINAVTAQMHKVTIDAGALTTTWDGTNTIATLGGALGDGFTFVVLAKDLIRVESVTNVVFSV